MSFSSVDCDNSFHSGSTELLATNSFFRTYRIRWAVVFVLALINGTSGFLWISYASIADHFTTFYSTNNAIFNWIQMLFPLTTILFGLPASLLVDYLGIRFVILSSSSFNLICAVLRMISSANPTQTAQAFGLPLLIAGQVIASFAQPLCMFSPTKLALVWFPDTQRTTANTIGSMGNTLGILFGSFIAPFFVKKPTDIPVFNGFAIGLTAFGFLLSLLVVRRSSPLTPPSVPAAVLAQLSSKRHLGQTRMKLMKTQIVQFLKNVTIPLKVASFWLLMINFSCGLAYFTALSSLLEQMLTPKGYTNVFAGVCGFAMLGGGLLSSGLAAIFVDKTGLLLETMKVCYVLAVFGAVGSSVALFFPHQQASFLISVIWMGTFGFAQYSLSLELAAEATFPVPESITTGLLISSSQVVVIIFILFMQAVAPTAQPNAYFHPTSDKQQDYAVPNMILCAVLTVFSVAQLFLLRLPYKRRLATEQNQQLDLPPDTILAVQPCE